MDLLAGIDTKESILKCVEECTANPDSPHLAFVAKVENEVVGAFVLAKDVNLEYYKSHFHI